MALNRLAETTKIRTDPLNTETGANLDSHTGFSLVNSPEHQGEKATGGNTNNCRVLYCTNLDVSLDYSDIYLIMKQHGKVEKIKLKAVDEGKSYDSYVLYSSHKFASLAHKYLNGHSINEITVRTKLYNEENIIFGPQDYIPSELFPGKPFKKFERKLPESRWFVAEYKHGENYIKAVECLKWKVGNIPDKNIKRYGKAILIEADNETSALLLKNFKPPSSGNIKSVTPHRTFNVMKGIIHSRDLYEFSEDEILQRCPENIYKVQKLKGLNNSILLFFSNQYLPDYVSVCNVRISVKKYRPNPKQCRNCLDYGHVKIVCQNKTKCISCSSEYEDNHACSNIKHCFHCSGNHGPTSKNCIRFRFEQDIVSVAENEHISFGSAKRKVLGANKDPNSTYASIAKEVKNNNIRGRQRFMNHNNNDSRPENSNEKNDQQKSHPSTSKYNDASAPTENQSQTVKHSNIIEAQADIHIGLQSSLEVLSGSDQSKSREGDKPLSVRPKSRFNLVDGFWSPPKNKRGRQSPPHKIELKTSNPFEVLDPFGPISDHQPMKKIALSSSCTEVNNMETSESHQEQTIYPRETSGENSQKTPFPVNEKDLPDNDETKCHTDEKQDNTIQEISPSPIIGATGRYIDIDPSKVKLAAKQLASTSKKDQDRSQKSNTKNQSDSRTSSENYRKSSKNRPTKLNRQSGSTKSSYSLSKKGKTGSSTPRHK